MKPGAMKSGATTQGAELQRRRVSGPGSPAGTRAATLALTAVCLAFFMVLLDGSALNVALPSIQHDVHGSVASLQWVVSVYTIPLASVLLTAGTVADRLGSRRLFVWSLTAFTAASLLCAMSPSLGTLIAARALQGVAAGGVLPTTLTILVHAYPDPFHRARAITVWGATGGVAIAAGPIVGGLLSDAFGWRAIFLINVPVGVLTVVLAARFARETPRRAGRSFDLPGQIAGVLALTLLVGWLIVGGSHGWAGPAAGALLVAAVVSVGVFVAFERRAAHPMLPFAVFRRAAFTASVGNGFAFQFGGYGVQFMLALYLQDRWRLDAAQTGLLLLPFGVGWFAGTLVINRRFVHRGVRWLLRTGAGVAAVGALLCLGVSGRDTWPVFLAGTVLVGVGSGVLSPSLNAAAMLSVDSSFAGLGSAVLNTARQVGMAVAVALLGTFVAMPDAELGLRVGIVLVAACFVTILGLSTRFLPRGEAGVSVPGVAGTAAERR